ncbi:MAG: aspartyl protease family protein [Isosphaerales bacterium]
MRIVGEWLTCDDLVRRPCVRGRVAGAGGTYSEDDFLIDTGADRTVFGAGLLAKLGIRTVTPSAEIALQGIGGNSAFVLLTTVLELTRDDGAPAHIRGEFAAFIDPTATDLSILGRDVLNHFDVILSRRRNEALLLAPNHQYRVELI